MIVRRLAIGLAAIAIFGGGAFWYLTRPQPLSAAVLPDVPGDAAKGETLFWAGGCASCHAAPGATGEDRLKLGGGVAIASPFGTFHAPNLSPDKTNGIGNWSTLDFVNAMKQGLAPDGSHLYPAFPYTSYQRMTIADLVDLKAFLDTLPAVTTANKPHELPFPFGIRRGIGLWKLLYLDGQTFEPVPSKSDEINRGAYLVEGPGHCNECHTPRTALGGLDRSRALGGAPDPSGKGTVPNITPGEGGIGDWSADDIANFLKTGFTPDFDSVGGTMVEVQENMAKLSDEDRQAIAAYLKDVPPLASTGQSAAP
ncbi:mono/diheme cytochrome c family protein [Kaistia dalseonensis]|uniref:Mono/diheme cytochrome c family protein n=1 Tax=Kaistia dalseonensis TaxID=410840 RepID=A0ABU0HD41_9HYPH|nr:mono/diheme cytochrome c family protein [Kaistia dalseonensis]